jgi:DNA-binding response OmpR family regulator
MAKILLVDNDENFLISRAEILEKSGYPVIPVKNLDKAREKLQANRYDLVVIDVLCHIPFSLLKR